MLKSFFLPRSAIAFVAQYSVYDTTEQQTGSIASAARVFSPTQDVSQTTSTGLAQPRAPSKNFVTALDMTAEVKYEAPPLEPAFEALLRSGNIHEDVVMACGVQDIQDREVFVALHHIVEGFTAAVTAGLGINPAGVLTQPRGGEGLEQRKRFKQK